MAKAKAKGIFGLQLAKKIVRRILHALHVTYALHVPHTMHVPHAMKQITLSYTAKNEQYQIEGFDDKASIQKYTFVSLFYIKTVASQSILSPCTKGTR